MSIQTELDRIISLVHESHEKAQAKGGTTTTPLLANLPGVIESIPQGVELPTLTNPGSASDLLSGKQLINADGNVVTGNIATKAASDLTASGATVTVPAGYYASQATKSVATATQATPSVSIDSAGKITASATQTAGYVVAGTKTGTKQLTTQAAKTITPSTSSQTAVAKNVYTTGAVTVAAIPSTYVKPTATKGATTYTPTTSNQTIAAGTYCSGVQTIKGDANLVAGNIKSGVSIFGVAGSYEGSGGSGGGDAVETCTVTFDNISWDCPIVVVSAIVVENGIYQTYINFSDSVDQLYTITIPNVVCGSEIGLGSCFYAGYGVAPYIEISGTASFNSWKWLSGVNTTFMTMTFTAPSVPNENCTISFAGNV